MTLNPTISIKKSDIADFMQKLSMLLETGYDACSAVELLAQKNKGKKKDRSADGIRAAATMLLPDLKEGFPLHEAMAAHSRIFGSFVNQVEVGESSGKTSEVLLRISEQIKNASKIMSRLKGAVAYPICTLLFAFAAAFYLFTTVVPDMLSMLSSVGSGEVPASTQLVMNIGTWLKSNGFLLLFIFGGLTLFLFFYGKTIGKEHVARMATNIPFLGKVIENNAMTMFFKNWQQMIFAGAEMSIALRSAAEAVPNLYLRHKLLDARNDYAENGVHVYEALRAVPSIRELELQTIQVALEGDKLTRVLGVLAEDRETEANRSINAMTAAINPLLLMIVGLIVGVLVMAIYEPIISISASIS